MEQIVLNLLAALGTVALCVLVVALVVVYVALAFVLTKSRVRGHE